MLLKLLIALLSTQAAKELVVYTVALVAKRTDNPIDDVVTRQVARLLGVTSPV